MKIKHTLAALLGCFALSNAHSQEALPINEIVIEKVVSETQVQPEIANASHVALGWWIPVEYWGAAFANDPNVTEAVKKEIQDTLNGYAILGVVQADVSSTGIMNFYSKNEISQSFTLKYENEDGKVIDVPPLKNVPNNVSLFLQQLTPILAAAMGNMGQNFNFIVYDDRDTENKRILDPYKKGKLLLNFTAPSADSDGEISASAVIETPLDSFHRARVCPNGKPAHVSWRFCPWSGDALK